MPAAAGLERRARPLDCRGMDPDFTTVAEFGPARSAELLARVFADYEVKLVFTEATLRQVAVLDDVVAAESPVVRVAGEPVGVALIARRGSESRVAGMGLVPAARGHGAGRALLERVLADARARGDRRVVLEAIARNTVAVRLYETAGFRRIRRLVGFAGPAPAGLRPDAALAEVGVRDVAAAVARQPGVDWPWQISAATLARLPAPATGYELDGAWLVALNPSGPVAGLRALVVEGDGQREARAARLLHAVMARHPAATEWRMSALLPEEFAGGFTAAGLAVTELHQWQMERRLAAD